MDNCYKHLDTEAKGVCANCERPYCAECEREYHDTHFCSLFCISQYKKKQRAHLFNYMTSMKVGSIYWGFFLLAVYVMYVFNKYQNAPDFLHKLLPYALIYILLGVILGIVFLLLSFINANKS